MAKILSLDKKKGKGYQAKANKAKKSGELWLYDEIGEYWGMGIGAKQVADDLKALGKIQVLDIYMNTPGGEVFDGFAIYNQLKRFDAEVRVHIDGLAASIGSVIAMAGDSIEIAANGIMMIHRAWGFCVGNCDDMKAVAEQLGLLDENIMSAYARANLPEDELRAMVEAETWMEADLAKELGFVDEIYDAKELAAKFDLKKYQYKNAPQGQAPGAQPVGIRSKLASLNLKAQEIRRRQRPTG